MQFKVPGDDEVYDLVTTKLTFGEAKAVEKVTGFTMSQIGALGENEQTTDILQAMFWISMKRKNPTLAYAELDDLPIEELEYLPEDDEERAAFDAGDPLGPTSPATDPVVESTPLPTPSPVSA